jgi:hypothetical protein
VAVAAGGVTASGLIRVICAARESGRCKEREEKHTG